MPGGRHLRNRAAASLAAAALVLALCGAALADNYSYHRVARDDASAAALTLKRSDLPASLRLTGGRVKPDETPNTETCNGYSPKESDLVVTGDAATRYSNKAAGILGVYSQVQLMKTSAMAATDVVRGARMLSRACSAQSAKSEHLKLLSFKSLGRATCACDFSDSITFETGTPNAAIHTLWVFTVMRRGRVEASLITGVGKSSADTQNLALRAALGIQGLAVKAISTRLASQ